MISKKLEAIKLDSATGGYVQWLYMDMAVAPNSYAFGVSGAVALIYHRVCDAEDLITPEEILSALERRSMYDAHSKFERASLMDREDVRRTAVKR